MLRKAFLHITKFLKTGYNAIVNTHHKRLYYLFEFFSLSLNNFKSHDIRWTDWSKLLTGQLMSSVVITAKMRGRQKYKCVYIYSYLLLQKWVLFPLWSRYTESVAHTIVASIYLLSIF